MVEITISNPTRPDLGVLSVQALIDTDAMHLQLPARIVVQLGLKSSDFRELTLPDGSVKQLPYVGPVEVRIGSFNCFAGALVLGDEPVLGQIPMAMSQPVVIKKTSTIRYRDPRTSA